MAPAVKRRRLDASGSVDRPSSPPFAGFGDDEESIKDDGDGSATVNGLSMLEDGNIDDAKTGSSAPNGRQHIPGSDDTSKKQPVQTTDRIGSRIKSKDRFKASHSSVLELQISDLLEQLRPRRNATAEEAEAALRDIKGRLETLDPISAKSVIDAERQLIKKHRVAVPFPEPRPAHDAQYQLSFQPPVSINVTGSHAFGSRLHTTDILDIDMMVQMPDELFQDKDFHDHRYFYRRAYYIACLAAALSPCAEYKTRFASFRGNPLQPVLFITPASNSPWKITLHPYVASSIFSNDRLLPHKICVRKSRAETGAAPLNGHPSSFYNSTIQTDRCMVPYLKIIHSMLKTCDAFKDAAILMRVWLKQRGIASDVAEGGLGGFEATALMASLLAAGLLSPRYRALQLFKATLQFLASKDCLKGTVIIGETSANLQPVPDVPILFDAARSHNLLYKMTAWSYKTLRAEARATVMLLGDQSSGAFEPTFIFRINTLHLRYDMTFAISNNLLTRENFDDGDVLLQAKPLYKALSRGLTDRVLQIQIKGDPQSTWDLDSARPSWRKKGTTMVSLLINPAAAGRTVDHGPSAHNKEEAAEYRKFWGDKAELRRFKDGSILEAVVWSSKEGEISLLTTIVTYIIDRHLGANAAAELRLVGGLASRLGSIDNSLSAFSSRMDTFKTLATDIRSLDELPLTVRQISPASPQMRFSSDVAAVQLKRSSEPIDVVVQFETSSRWPDDLQAVQRTKIAMLLKMSSLLAELASTPTTRVGIENTATPSLNQAFLDIAYSTSPATFRIRIHHERELSLVQTLLHNKSLAPSQRDEAAAALAQHKRLFAAAPAHTASIVRHATRYPALSPTIRLVKKWFAAHHLTSHFPEALIELFCLRTFLLPAPYSAPGTGRTGLYRVLAWLARWDWRSEPLLLPPTFSAHAGQSNSQSPHASVEDSTDAGAAAGKEGQPRTEEQWLRQARTRFTAWRRLDPSLNRVVLFVASEADPDGTVWSDLGVAGAGPARVAAARMSALARAAAQEITKNELELNVETLYASSLGDFDFVVRLAAGGSKRAKTKFKNLQDVSDDQEVGLDAVGLLLEELKRLYGNSAVFFYGGEGSRIVGGLWNPVTESRQWKVNLAYSTVPVPDDEGGAVLAAINKEGILSEIARLGGEIIDKIETK